MLCMSELQTIGFSVPILFIVFNRPDETARVFDSIRTIRPSRLFIAADGPRENRLDDMDLCKKVREIIKIDWECEVSYKYSQGNLGCMNGPVSAIDWVLGQVEEAIILEDDCLPDISFYAFCKEMLMRYKDDTRIGAIMGTNEWERPDYSHLNKGCSYFFSRYFKAWGWATWARTWKGNDVYIKKWPIASSEKFLSLISRDRFVRRYWTRIYDITYQQKVNSWWDYQWMFYNWLENRLFVVPAQNMVSNLGFSPTATHTKAFKSPRQVVPMVFPLRHPSVYVPCLQMDEDIARTHYRLFPRWYWIVIILQRLIHPHRWHRLRILLTNIRNKITPDSR